MSWRTEEDRELQRMAAVGMSRDEIAEQLGRSRSRIDRRLKKLEIKTRGKGWGGARPAHKPAEPRRHRAPRVNLAPGITMAMLMAGR